MWEAIVSIKPCLKVLHGARPIHPPGPMPPPPPTPGPSLSPCHFCSLPLSSLGPGCRTDRQVPVVLLSHRPLPHRGRWAGLGSARLSGRSLASAPGWPTDPSTSLRLPESPHPWPKSTGVPPSLPCVLTACHNHETSSHRHLLTASRSPRLSTQP